MKRKQIIITVLVGLIILGALVGGGYWAVKYYGGSSTPIDENVAQNDSNGTNQNNTIEPKVDDSAKGIPVPANYANLDRSHSQYTPEQDAKYIEELNKRISLIQKTPTSVWAWVELGGIKYGFYDDKGAEEAWIHATKLAPTHTVSHANLATLYWRRLNNYSKAEEQLKIILKNDFTYVPAYRDLSDLYRYNFTTKSALADDILKEGIAKLPTEYDLLAHLAYYYFETKDWANAVTYLKQLVEVRPTDTQVAGDLSSARQSLANQ